jgi:hypothetical protein
MASANLATRHTPFTARATKLADLQSFSKRMKGLEPSTFCMAKAGERSRLFARVRRTPYLQPLSTRPANGGEPERTPIAAIAAIVIRGIQD